jgi:prenyl protein peptidase
MGEPLQLFAHNSDSLYAGLKSEIAACGTVILHTTLLYLGPIVHNVAAVLDLLQQKRANSSSTSSSCQLTVQSFSYVYYRMFLEPTLCSLRFRRNFESSRSGWIAWRNLIIAPVTEEIVFRGCIVSCLAVLSSESVPLNLSSLSTLWVTITAPLFFGLSHVHHGLVKLRRGHDQLSVAVQTFVQFAYTSLFGSYATYVFLQTRSLFAPTLCHAYCNGMGLPDLSFLQQHSPLYRFRGLIMGAHFAGLLCFLTTVSSIGTLRAK